METTAETQKRELLKQHVAFAGPGWWLPWIGVVSYAVCGYAGLQLGKPFGFGPPGDERPWYFLRVEFVSGACMAAGLLVCVLIALVTWRTYPANARALLWFAFLWSGGSAWKAFVIWLGSRNLFDPALATTRWPNFEAYFRDPVIWAGQVAVWVGVLLFAGSRIFPGWRRSRD